MIYYDEDGEVLAKNVLNKWTQNEVYYARMENGHLVDPNNRDTRLRIKETGKLKTINREAYLLYVAFLKSKSQSTLKKAERAL